MTTPLKTLDELSDQWKEDAEYLQKTDMILASASIGKLHSKYSDWLSRYVYAAHEANTNYNRMRLLRIRYFRGDLNADPELLKKLGWEPLQKKIDTSLVKEYLEGDNILTTMKLNSLKLEELADKCKRIISALSAKGFALQANMKYKMFLLDGSE